MTKIKGNCNICETEIEIQLCCNGFRCGCMGQPIYPPVCSKECYDKLIEKYKSAKPVDLTLK